MRNIMQNIASYDHMTVTLIKFSINIAFMAITEALDA
jgi:hypothetical protein